MRNFFSKILALSIGLIYVSSIFAADKDYDKDKSIRLGLIGANQIGLGVNMGYWSNTHLSLRLMYQLGSYRNIMNMYAGSGYSIRIPTGEVCNIYLTHHVPICLGAKCNYFSWQRNSLYVGAETEYNVYVGNSPVSRGYWAISGSLGCRIQACDIHIQYTYDLAPAYNQKLIYESPDYDFSASYRAIYERMFIGLGITYYFTFGL